MKYVAYYDETTREILSVGGIPHDVIPNDTHVEIEKAVAIDILEGRIQVHKATLHFDPVTNKPIFVQNILNIVPIDKGSYVKVPVFDQPQLSSINVNLYTGNNTLIVSIPDALRSESFDNIKVENLTFVLQEKDTNYKVYDFVIPFQDLITQGSIIITYQVKFPPDAYDLYTEKELNSYAFIQSKTSWHKSKNIQGGKENNLVSYRSVEKDPKSKTGITAVYDESKEKLILTLNEELLAASAGHTGVRNMLFFTLNNDPIQFVETVTFDILELQKQKTISISIKGIMDLGLAGYPLFDDLYFVKKKKKKK